MEAPGKRLYRAKEFASLAGVSVRTLHHYDSLGLLAPTARTDAGYRLYGDADMERLEQILALRFVGLELEHIRKLLDGSSQPLVVALLAQKQIMYHAMRQLQSAINAIDTAHAAISHDNDDESRSRAVQTLIEAFKMKNDHTWTEQYYSPEALEKLAEIRRTTSPDVIEKGQRDWAELIAEVELAAAHEDPASDRAKSLAQRWRDLVKQFTRGNVEVHDGLNRMYNDPSGWPKDFKRPWSDAADEFIKKAMHSLG